MSFIADLVGAAGSVLDIGCRDKTLQRHLPTGTRYVGMDLASPADVIASADDRLPFNDDEFDVAVFADVLEHLDRPLQAVQEGIRVASEGVVIVLPNQFYYQHRLGVLRGRLHTDKYDFNGRSEDRHRWWIHFDQAREFIREAASTADWQIDTEVAYDGGPTHPVTRAINATLTRVASPAVWAFAYAARLTPQHPNPS